MVAHPGLSGTAATDSGATALSSADVAEVETAAAQARAVPDGGEPAVPGAEDGAEVPAEAEAPEAEATEATADADAPEADAAADAEERPSADELDVEPADPAGAAAEQGTDETA